jgi:transcriptional regulator with XRE-family HTH domain
VVHAGASGHDVAVAGHDRSPAASLGEIIRRQRELSELSMRQFATMAGISNPYLSQIERGLREPSEKVMEAIAEALHTSADTLYAQAGLDDEPEDAAVVDAIRADPRLTAAQRRALITTYEGFLAANGEPRRRRRRDRA